MPGKRSTAKGISATSMARGEKPVSILVEAHRSTDWTHTLLPYIAEEGRRRGWQLFSDPATLQIIPDLKLSGALLQSLPDSGWVAKLRARKCPAVRLGRFAHPEDDKLPAVLPDIAEEGRLAAEHFAERCFRHVGYVDYNPWTLSRPIYEHFHEMAEQMRMECHQLRFSRKENEQAGAAKARWEVEFAAWLKSTPKPLGLLCRGVKLASYFALLSIAEGYGIPTDLALLGRCSDDRLCDTMHPSLSAVQEDNERQVRTACELLDSIMNGTPAPEAPILIPPKGITVRASTETLAASDPAVRKAIRFMQDNYADSITVEDAVWGSGISRTKLFRAFNQDLGKTPHAVLMRIRLDKAKLMLRETDATLLEVAEACGFGHPVGLHHHFKKNLDISPGAYRKHARQA